MRRLLEEVFVGGYLGKLGMGVYEGAMGGGGFRFVLFIHPSMLKVGRSVGFWVIMDGCGCCMEGFEKRVMDHRVFRLYSMGVVMWITASMCFLISSAALDRVDNVQ